MYKLPDFFKFLKFVFKLQSADWFGPFTSKINDKNFETKNPIFK